MIMLNVAYAMGTNPGASGQAGGGQYMSIVLLVAIVGIFYFLMIRPQQKRAKEHRSFLENLKKGDKIITSGGLYGTITGITDDAVTIEIAEKVRVKVDKNTVAALQRS
ncbi:MAG TPA: preprotein translocase subunit YajC [Syntrophorhabdaceae bacterium]|nr:preprotein translocase subunit YajC [Syntrophorhabdaceae bacterium]